MPERETLYKGTTYHVSDFTTGLNWARDELAGLIEEARGTGQVAEIAGKIVPKYQVAPVLCPFRPGSGRHCESSGSTTGNNHSPS